MAENIALNDKDLKVLKAFVETVGIDEATFILYSYMNLNYVVNNMVKAGALNENEAQELVSKFVWTPNEKEILKQAVLNDGYTEAALLFDGMKNELSILKCMYDLGLVDGDLKYDKPPKKRGHLSTPNISFRPLEKLGVCDLNLGKWSKEEDEVIKKLFNTDFERMKEYFKSSDKKRGHDAVYERAVKLGVPIRNYKTYKNLVFYGERM